MKTYTVRKLAFTGDANELSTFMDNEHVELDEVGCVNWEKDFPAKPIVRFRIATSEENLLLNYKIEEDFTRGIETEDNGQVWLDSCAECFLQVNDAPAYFNIECNCIGTLLIGYGPCQRDRTHLDKEKLKLAKRYSTLGRGKLEEITKQTWELSLIIPLSLFGITSTAGMRARGNVFKCGDELTVPHFLSWNPIQTETPSFHQPSFFGEFVFE